jgi:2-deoxy-D-gluconate 3-dehydrogenase
MSGLFDLAGRVAVVTGGNGGIGFGIASGLARAGAAVVVAGRRAEKNAEAVQALERLDAKAMAFAGDLKEESVCRALMQTAVSEFGRLDILVNNAGIAIRKPPEAYSLAEWHGSWTRT